MRWTSGLAVLPAFLAGCCGVGPERVIALFGGEEKIEIIMTATGVEAFRLSPPTDSGPGGAVTAGPVPVDIRTSHELSSILLDTGTYCSRGNACRPTPGVKVSFTRESSSLDVYFCFECDILIVREGEQVVGKADCDYGRGALIPIMKRLFPQDPVIQGLKN